MGPETVTLFSYFFGDRLVTIRLRHHPRFVWLPVPPFPPLTLGFGTGTHPSMPWFESIDSTKPTWHSTGSTGPASDCSPPATHLHPSHRACILPTAIQPLIQLTSIHLDPSVNPPMRLVDRAGNCYRGVHWLSRIQLCHVQTGKLGASCGTSIMRIR